MAAWLDEDPTTHSTKRSETSGAFSAPTESLRPFFAAPRTLANAPRLLLLSYHFPPSTETGALRWDSMVHYAAEWGWEVDVVTLMPDRIDDRALERLRLLPEGCRLYGAPTHPALLERLESALRRTVQTLRRTLRHRPLQRGTPSAEPEPTAQQVLSLRTAEVKRLPPSPRQVLRAYFAWREFVIQRPWCRDASRIATKLARQTRYDAVITCGPPHLVHTVGARLARRTGLPLVLDLRDPWSLQRVLPAFRASNLWYRLARRYEQESVAEASVISLNTEPCRDAMRVQYPAKSEAMVVATNGYDEREAAPPVQDRDERFLITYAGSLYFVYEHPLPFFLGVSMLVQEFGLRPHQLGVEFIGHSEQYEGEPVADIANAAGLRGFFHGRPHLPRHQVMERLNRASVLVSLAQFNDLAIPSKIFDYMRCGAWIVAVASPGSATEALLRDTGADVVHDNTATLIHQALRRRYLEFLGGIRPKPIAPNTHSSRREQAAVFFNAVRQAVPGRLSA
jgi:hypothetical protein